MLKWLEKEGYKIEFGFIDKGTLGCVNFESKTIYLNPILLLVRVFAHEYCHAKHSDPSEKRTDQREFKKMKRMSGKEMRKLGVALVKLWSKNERRKK